MQKRSNDSDAVSNGTQQLTVLPHAAIENAARSGHPAAEASATGKWFHFANLKIEAAIFMLIALTFVAVVGQEAITSKQFDLAARSGQYSPFIYGDKDDGGQSTATYDTAAPLKWSCTLRPGAQFHYCGYGLQIDTTSSAQGIDLSNYQDVTLHLNYRGVGDHLRLVLQNTPTAALAGKVQKGDSMPFVAQFTVVQGANDIHLTKDQFFVEPWWLNKYHLTPDEGKAALSHVVSVAFSSGDATPYGTFDVVVDSLAFNGVFMTTDQWYLMILGVWLVLTGAFLVYRFLSLRRGYEARQRQQAEEARILSEARAAAEQASAAKSQFLANMSHELRTPLNAILGYAQLLKRAELGDRDLAAVKTIQNSGEHLLTMISDILDIAKVEAGRLELLPASFDMRACVGTVTQMIRLRAEEKGLSFAVEIGDEVPQIVVGDQKRVRQVLLNLLGNAVKFTVAGEVRLILSAVSAGDGRVRMRFDIVDSGVGIANDQIDRIFRPFEQAGNIIDRSGGTGLGLSITHQIVEVMHGEIQVESVVGQGSRFSVEMPFELGASGILAAATETDQGDDIIATGLHGGPVPPMVAPQGEPMERLLALARAGNLRAIRKEIALIVAADPQYRDFAEHLDGLAAAYQSPAVLRLIEQYAPQRSAA